MSSLHHDRLVVEGSEPVTGTAGALPIGRGRSRRAVGTTAKQAISKVPTQRPGTAQRTGTTPSAATPAAPKRAAGTKAAAATGALASRARTATIRAATVGAATAKAATAKAATAARSAAVSTVANHTSGVRSARTAAVTEAAPVAEPPAVKSAAQPVADEASATTAAMGDAAGAEAAPRLRPTPYKRVDTAEAAVAGSVPPVDVAGLGAADPVRAAVVPTDVPADSAVLRGARLPLLRRRPTVAGGRPALYLAAALAGAISLSAVSAVETRTHATAAVSSPVSVAEQLGIEAAPTDAVVDADTTQRLGELAISRNTREAEQAAAIQVQAEADRIAAEAARAAAEAAAQAAAEAARAKAVFPIAGARLTSPFGPRWGTVHTGVDLAAPMLTPEFAAMDGVVLEAGPASGFGLAVYIQHENGDVTVYGHMEKILVEAGEVVRAGDTIALVGNRGQSTGPHLHFEVRTGGLDGRKVDPLSWLRAAGVDT